MRLHKYISKILLLIILLCNFSTAHAAEKEIFYGKWIIKETVGTYPVDVKGEITYKEYDVKKLIGKEITYAPDKIIYYDIWNDKQDMIAKPYYEKMSFARGKGWPAPDVLSSVGINQDTITRIDVINNKEESISVNLGPGSTFFIRDNDTLIAPDGGFFFKLIRKK